MFRSRIGNVLGLVYKAGFRRVLKKFPRVMPLAAGIASVACEQSEYNNVGWDENSLEHEFLIRQATTVNVNAASQLLTVTIVAIQDTSERLRKALTREIALVQQAMEWGDGTPPEHWDDLVAIRGTLTDLKHNLCILLSYMDYVEKVATSAAEISYLSGNLVASDALCERIDHANRTCKEQKQLNRDLQNESLEMQQQAIAAMPQLQDKIIENSKMELKENAQSL